MDIGPENVDIGTNNVDIRGEECAQEEKRLVNIIFVCHGSICRSPAAEFLFRDYAKAKGRENEFSVSSLALSSEEIGNPVYPRMKAALLKKGVHLYPHLARRLAIKDIEEADYVFYMDESNRRRLSLLIDDPKKVLPIFAFTSGISEIEDPWYTDRYEFVIDQLKRCIEDIWEQL